jgi:fluoroacetyl-CoA thioesterase
VKPIPPGYTSHHRLVVEERMTVDFEQDDPALGKLHPVYSTYWLAKHAELVARKIILPFLEAGEAGIGYHLELTHMASALPGMEVKLRARHLRTEGNRVHAEVTAWNELGDVIGEGTTTQVILEAARLEAGFARLRARWAARGQG